MVVVSGWEICGSLLSNPIAQIGTATRFATIEQCAWQRSLNADTIGDAGRRCAASCTRAQPMVNLQPTGTSR